MKELDGIEETKMNAKLSVYYCDRTHHHIVDRYNFIYSTFPVKFARFVWPGREIKITGTRLKKKTNTAHSCVSFPDLSHLGYF